MRGVSPLVATVLLILISIATSVILWTWVSSMVSQTSSEVPFLTERIKIEAVSVSENIVRIFVRNLVDNEVKIGSSYIINGSSGLTIAQNLNSFRINGGSVVEIDIELKTILPKGVYIAKVTTIKGYEASYVFAVT
ncbi:MAG: hypothetical protein QXO98_02720 [Sulfolobales archaeon]